MELATSQAQANSKISLHGGRAVILVVTLILCVLSYQLNASMISPALPDIAKSLHVGVNAVSRVSSLFFLAGSIGGVVLSRWSDFIGRRRSLVVVILILAAGTLLCIYSPNLTILLVGRVLQGASSAAFQLSYVILNESLSQKVFGTVLGILTAVNGGVGGFDGYVGGLLSDHYGFRSIFVVILILAAIALLCVMWVVPKDSQATQTTGKMDWWGAAALSVGLICLTYFVSDGSSAGWTAPITLLYLLGTVVFFTAFWFIEKTISTPMIAVHHLRSRQVWPVIATTVLTLTGVFSVINFTVVLLSQDQKIGFGLNAAHSGLMFLTPAALIGVGAAPLSGWLAGKWSWTKLLRVGMVLCILDLIVIALVPQSKWAVFALVAILGITYNGFVLTTANGLGVLQSPAEAPAALPGLNGAAFGIGAGLGIGLVAPLVGKGTLGGYTTALWISVGITVLAFVATLFIQPKQAQVQIG